MILGDNMGELSNVKTIGKVSKNVWFGIKYVFSEY